MPRSPAAVRSPSFAVERAFTLPRRPCLAAPSSPGPGPRGPLLERSSPLRCSPASLNSACLWTGLFTPRSLAPSRKGAVAFRRSIKPKRSIRFFTTPSGFRVAVAVVFRVVDDSLWVERVYSFGTGALTLGLVGWLGHERGEADGGRRFLSVAMTFRELQASAGHT